MSGLFSRLAERALGAEVGAARLRVATPYEPDGGEPPVPELAVEGAAPEADAPRLARGPAALTRKASVPVVPAARALTTPSVAAPAVETTAATAPQPTPALVDDVGAAAPAWRAAAAPAADGERVSVEPATSRTSPALPASTVPRARAAAAELAPRDDLAPRPRTDPGEADGRRRTVDDPAAVDDAPLLPAAPRSERFAPAPGPASSERRVASEPAPRPVVRVTIGRIDVRGAAPVAPAPSRPAPARHQPLPLDEYLRRRDRGGGEPR